MELDFLESIFVNFLCILDHDKIFLNRNLITRCIAYALLISHDIRRDTSMTILLRAHDAYDVIFLVGNKLRQLRPDERSTWGILGKALKRLNASKRRLSRAHWGVYTLRDASSQDIQKLKSNYKCMIITEHSGKDLLVSSLPKGPLLIILDVRPLRLSPHEYEILHLTGSYKYAVGEVPVDYAISIVNWMLDNRVKI